MPNLGDPCVRLWQVLDRHRSRRTTPWHCQSRSYSPRERRQAKLGDDRSHRRTVESRYFGRWLTPQYGRYGI